MFMHGLRCGGGTARHAESSLCCRPWLSSAHSKPAQRLTQQPIHPPGPQDILSYEGGASVLVEGCELGPGDLKILRDFRPPEGSKPGQYAFSWLAC